MQRPVMNPTFYQPLSETPRRFRALRLVARMMWRTIRTAWRIITYDPLRRRLRIEEGPWLTRLARGFAYRLAFVPVLLALMVCLIVYASTHPHVPQAEVDPATIDLYYDVVTLLTVDQIRLDGVLYPVINAKQVLEEKERALRKKYPAVVLVHDFGMRREQMLPLVRPLHDAGFVVLAVNLRGNGASGAAAQTFGLREALDVKASVELLRRNPFVDPSRIVIIGAGTGGTAAMLHAKVDNAIPALVVIDPIQNVDRLVDTKLAPRQSWLSWTGPLCRWTFQIGYQLNLEDIAWSQFEQLRESRPILVLGREGSMIDLTRPRNVDQIRSFLVEHIVVPKMPVVKAGE